MLKKISLYALPVIVMGFASFFASSHPDTLEFIADVFSFGNKAKETSTLIADYSISFLPQGPISTFLAGLIGIALIYILYKAIAALFVRIKK
jgi:hypothetical protein